MVKSRRSSRSWRLPDPPESPATELAVAGAGQSQARFALGCFMKRIRLGCMESTIAEQFARADHLTVREPPATCHKLNFGFASTNLSKPIGMSLQSVA